MQNYPFIIMAKFQNLIIYKLKPIFVNPLKELNFIFPQSKAVKRRPGDQVFNVSRGAGGKPADLINNKTLIMRQYMVGLRLAR